MKSNVSIKKYKLSDEIYTHFGNILRRVIALRSFGDVSEGDVGGWIGSEDNLSQQGDCWVAGDSMVFGNAVISDNAVVKGCCKVFGNASVRGNAKLSGCVIMYGHSQVRDSAHASDHAMIYGNAMMTDTSRLCDDAWLLGDAVLSMGTSLSGNMKMYTNGLEIGKQTLSAEWFHMGNYRPSTPQTLRDLPKRVPSLGENEKEWTFSSKTEIPE